MSPSAFGGIFQIEIPRNQDHSPLISKELHRLLRSFGRKRRQQQEEKMGKIGYFLIGLSLLFFIIAYFKTILLILGYILLGIVTVFWLYVVFVRPFR